MSDEEFDAETLAQAKEDIAAAEEFIQVMASGINTFGALAGETSREVKVASLVNLIKDYTARDGSILVAAVAMTLLSENPPAHWPKTSSPMGWPL